MPRLLAALRKSGSERGATMVEYGFMVVLIASVVVLAVGPLGRAVSTFFASVPGAF